MANLFATVSPDKPDRVEEIAFLINLMGQANSLAGSDATI